MSRNRPISMEIKEAVARKTGENPAWPSCRLHSSVSVSPRALSSPPFRRRYTYVRDIPAFQPVPVSRISRFTIRAPDQKVRFNETGTENRLGLFSNRSINAPVSRAFLLSTTAVCPDLSLSLSLPAKFFFPVFCCCNAVQTDRDRNQEWSSR